MTKVIGLTGGIGAGKSTVAKLFEYFGVPVFNSDIEAKKAYTDLDCRAAIAELFPKAFTGDQVDYKQIAREVFSSSSTLEKLNAIIHPFVKSRFEAWKREQKVPVVAKEAAILFESGGDKICDITIVVTAPKEVRVKRVLDRDGVSNDMVEMRMNAQWSQDKIASLADVSIENHEELLIPQVLKAIILVS